MKTSLTIRWDGTTPGLSEHALSLDAWLTPLELLLRAVRLTASGMVTEAVDDPTYGSRGGRLHKSAEDIDLRLTALAEGCVSLAFECAAPPPDGQRDPFLDALPGRALGSILDAIEAESGGELRSAPVRKFLMAMPKGVEVQEYRLVAGASSRSVVVTTQSLPTAPPSLPSLATLVGPVIGVGFDPGRCSVAIRVDGRSMVLDATERQVDTALALRGAEVRAVAVLGKRQRLVSLHDAGEGPPPLSPDEREALYFDRWARTLEILSR